MKADGFLIKTGAWLGASGIVLGALGAHALKASLAAPQLESFETGVRYQLLMALFFLVLAVLPVSDRAKRFSGWTGLLGVLFFSGSIYMLSTRVMHGLPVGFLGPVTPIGGLLMIAAWVRVAFGSVDN
jgi:uncharacterized membrane protein YgdD (TMEM256/DUF423 family)